MVGSEGDLFDANEASSDHKEKHDTPDLLLKRAGIVYYPRYGPIDVISNPHRLKLTH